MHARVGLMVANEAKRLDGDATGGRMLDEGAANAARAEWGDRADVDVAPGLDELLDVRPR